MARHERNLKSIMEATQARGFPACLPATLCSVADDGSYTGTLFRIFLRCVTQFPHRLQGSLRLVEDSRRQTAG